MSENGPIFEKIAVFDDTKSNKRYTVKKITGHAMLLTDAVIGHVAILQFAPGFITARGSQPGFIAVAAQEGKVSLAVTSMLKNKDFFIDIHKNSPNGPTLNQINVVRGGETVTIKSDYSQQERELILKTHESNQTVQQDEANSAGSKGLYLYITVGPEQGMDFTKAQWSCQDYIVQEENILRTQGGNYWQHQGEGFGEGFHPHQQVSRFTTHGSLPRPVQGIGCFPTPAAAVISTVQTFGSTAPQPAISPPSPSYGAPLVGMGGPGADDYELGTFSAVEPDYASFAKAAKLEHGETVQVRGREIVKDFDFTKAVPVVLCLSVLPTGLTMMPPVTESMADILDLVKSHIVSGNKRLLESIATVYKETECCICLESAPNLVIARCGHACLHAACKPPVLPKCPLCRGNILATINL